MIIRKYSKTVLMSKKLVKHLRVDDTVYIVNDYGTISQNLITSISKESKIGIELDKTSGQNTYSTIKDRVSFLTSYSYVAYLSMNDAIAAAKTILHERIFVLNKDIAQKTININELLKELNEYPKM